MVSLAAKLFQVLTKHPYEPLLRVINQDEKCSKTDLEEERTKDETTYMIDTTRCISKGGKLKPNGVFDIFTR